MGAQVFKGHLPLFIKQNVEAENLCRKFFVIELFEILNESLQP